MQGLLQWFLRGLGKAPVVLIHPETLILRVIVVGELSRVRLVQVGVDDELALIILSHLRVGKDRKDGLQKLVEGLGCDHLTFTTFPFRTSTCAYQLWGFG